MVAERVEAIGVEIMSGLRYYGSSTTTPPVSPKVVHERYKRIPDCIRAVLMALKTSGGEEQ
jgi:hypothetical protein